MFDAATSHLLRSAPELPDLDPNDLPSILTTHYAELASIRIRGAGLEQDVEKNGWNLERIADTYELLVSLQPKSEKRGPAAFVAGTARQILARRLEAEEKQPAIISRDRISPALASAVLFLISEQYGDANEAASSIRPGDSEQIYQATILSENIADLARGNLNGILKRSSRARRPIKYEDMEESAFAALLDTLSLGLEILASQLLGVEISEEHERGFKTSEHAFERVLELSAGKSKPIDNLLDQLEILYAGPYHLASLLLSTVKSLQNASLIKTPAPSGSNEEIWKKWLRFRAEKFPFVWSNHREAINKKFYETGFSAVVVLPTGAGKTTISSLKIAGALARNKKVIFLAPTHALVDQLTEDLQEMFPKEVFGAVVWSDFDSALQEDAEFQDIEVMTPERCLAMLCFSPESFNEVGLLVFDECHLLSGVSGKLRRALDSMLCVLGFTHLAPEADLIFLSAMVKNGEEFSLWISNLTGRKSVSVDLLWKPSRQARGVIIYDGQQLETSITRALKAQNLADKKANKKAKELRTSAKSELLATPFAIWGVQHNWLSKEASTVSCITTQILENPINLTANMKYGRIRLTPNANQVAINIAVGSAKRKLKTIVFVNTKRDAINVANSISMHLADNLDLHQADVDDERWDALKAELGDLKHSLISRNSIAVPHNSSMFRMERDIAERHFKRLNGAMVIVATPTLAQGLNLPAHLAILAGDKRASEGGREDLEAHEILNAAARAGRAGHVANGLVLMIPEPIISFKTDQPLDYSVVEKLQSILPEDDRCVEISDAAEIVLDRIMQGKVTDPDVIYTINRLAILQRVDEFNDSDCIFDLQKSFGAFVAMRRNESSVFDSKIEAFKNILASQNFEQIDYQLAVLSSQSGLSASLLSNLKLRIIAAVGTLPTTVVDWVKWMLNWFKEDGEARIALLGDIQTNILAACGKDSDEELTNADFELLLNGLISWLEGKDIRSIENILGGDSAAETFSKRICPRARELIGTIIPRGISYSIGLIAHVIKFVDPYQRQPNLDSELVECLSTALRRGYNTVELVHFAFSRKDLISRVHVHAAWQRHIAEMFEDLT